MPWQHAWLDDEASVASWEATEVPDDAPASRVSRSVANTAATTSFMMISFGCLFPELQAPRQLALAGTHAISHRSPWLSPWIFHPPCGEILACRRDTRPSRYWTARRRHGRAPARAGGFALESVPFDVRFWPETVVAGEHAFRVVVSRSLKSSAAGVKGASKATWPCV